MGSASLRGEVGGALKTDVRTGMNASPSMIRQLLGGSEGWRKGGRLGGREGGREGGRDGGEKRGDEHCLTPRPLPVRGSKGREEQPQNCSESGVLLCGGVQPHQQQLGQQVQAEHTATEQELSHAFCSHSSQNNTLQWAPNHR